MLMNGPGLLNPSLNNDTQTNTILVPRREDNRHARRLAVSAHEKPELEKKTIAPRAGAGDDVGAGTTAAMKNARR